MLAEPRDQQRLLDLADLDTKVSQVLHQRRILPQHAEIVELAEERKQIASELVAANTALSDAEFVLDKAERDLEPVRDRLARDRQRLDDGAVSDPKVINSMLIEVGKLEQRISDLEDAQLEAMSAVEDASAVQVAVDGRRKDSEARLRQLMVDRDAALAKLDAEVAELQVERKTIVAELPKDLVTMYEKVRERTGLGAARLERNRCTGCGLELNSSELRRIAAAMSKEVLRCEECSRILVRTNANAG